jgi:hypothetical protein
MEAALLQSEQETLEQQLIEQVIHNHVIHYRDISVRSFIYTLIALVADCAGGEQAGG